MEISAETIRKHNQRMINSNASCMQAIQAIKDIESFIADFSCLEGATNIILSFDKHMLLPTMFYNSFQMTIGSIASCCESACIADASTLLRKYRDDIFFYLYLVAYHNNKMLPQYGTIEANINDWFDNKLKDLHIGDVMKAISNVPELSDAILKYKLKDSFDVINNRLNNYVHSNGINYYNRAVMNINETVLQLLSIKDDVIYITVVFLFLITLLLPLTIMSSEYIDCLELGITPPDGSQYWVAPFVSDFLKENIKVLDVSCLNYLRDNTNMEI